MQRVAVQQHLHSGARHAPSLEILQDEACAFASILDLPGLRQVIFKARCKGATQADSVQGQGPCRRNWRRSRIGRREETWWRRRWTQTSSEWLVMVNIRLSPPAEMSLELTSGCLEYRTHRFIPSTPCSSSRSNHTSQPDAVGSASSRISSALYSFPQSICSAAYPSSLQKKRAWTWPTVV